MNRVEVLPELKEIVGALLFGAREPVTSGQIRSTLVKVAESKGGAAADFGKVTDKDIREAIKALALDLDRTGTGMTITEVAKGYRLENNPACGPWLKEFLNKGKPNRLSRPSLETLAIIAYRQPVARSEIESIRGVAVDQIVRNLLELQLIRAVGRSELPGRPWLFGTTGRFMEHFGLRSLEDLPGIEELKRMQNEAGQSKKKAEADAARASETADGQEPPVDKTADKSTDEDA